VGFGLLVAGSGLALYFGAFRHHHLFRNASVQIAEKIARFGANEASRYFVVVALLTVVHSLLEEYYWRWFVFGGLTAHLAFWPAAVLSSLAFMAYHVIDLSVFFPGKLFSIVLPLGTCVAVGGIAWCWLYSHARSIYAPWISHLIIDAAIMGVGYDLLFIRNT
jgi:membrane protease YdiL (CAAX protease family)